MQEYMTTREVRMVAEKENVNQILEGTFVPPN
jgi:hypothetical protein